MRDEQNGGRLPEDALGGELPGGGVERAEACVEDDQVEIREQGARHSDETALPVGELPSGFGDDRLEAVRIRSTSN
jgi:hypothetical protein